MILYPATIWFMRRRSDKKLYRGARFWRWTRFWRFAAVMPESSWRFFPVWRHPDTELVSLDQLIDEAKKKGP